MNEVAIFDLDGTLIDLKIDTDDFERCRSSWASYLTFRGVPTTLKPLLPELQRISQTSLGSRLRIDILKSFDEIELPCRYGSLCRIEAVLGTFKLKFRKLLLVTHNGLALWERLTQENTWPRLIDMVITRDDMSFFKPDPRVCEAAFKGLTPNFGNGECWVVGNSEADRGLGVNLRRKYSNLVVRTFIINPTCTAGTRLTDQLDVDVQSVDSLLNLVQDVPT
jgi:FMN phosphatase YigB (HAD superfamily)